MQWTTLHDQPPHTISTAWHTARTTRLSGNCSQTTTHRLFFLPGAHTPSTLGRSQAVGRCLLLSSVVGHHGGGPTPGAVAAAACRRYGRGVGAATAFEAMSRGFGRRGPAALGVVSARGPGGGAAVPGVRAPLRQWRAGPPTVAVGQPHGCGRRGRARRCLLRGRVALAAGPRAVVRTRATTAHTGSWDGPPPYAAAAAAAAGYDGQWGDSGTFQ